MCWGAYACERNNFFFVTHFLFMSLISRFVVFTYITEFPITSINYKFYKN